MSKHKSITQRLRYKLHPNVKHEIMSEWAQQKQDDFFDAYNALETAIGNDDYQAIDDALDDLKNIGIKSFSAIPNIAKALLDTAPDGDYD